MSAHELADALAALVEFEDDPPHFHEVEGVWDESNGPPLGGTACDRCAAFARARELLEAEG